jgi:hypothetical protein
MERQGGAVLRQAETVGEQVDIGLGTVPQVGGELAQVDGEEAQVLAQVEARRLRALGWAAKSGQEQMVEFILRRGAKPKPLEDGAGLRGSGSAWTRRRSWMVWSCAGSIDPRTRPAHHAPMRTLLLLALLSCAASAPAGELRLARFSADVTVPLGHRLMGVLPVKAKEIVDPLLARGFALVGAGEPIVLVAADWCEIRNGAYERWREALAEAAGTRPERVLVASVHQHDAPVADLDAERLLAEVGLAGELLDVAFHEAAVSRVAQALREALPAARRVTHLGLGEARVERIASNRRVELPGGRVSFERGSSSGGDPRLRDAPEGLIDPWLKTLSFWDGDEPLLALHAYATHPMSRYGRGEVSADFPGLARRLREAEEPGVLQVYCSGASGDVTAGKYNDGAPENRRLLGERLLEAMRAAWNATRRLPFAEVRFRSERLDLEFHDGEELTAAALRRRLADPAAPVESRILAALGLASRQRLERGKAIDLPALDFGAAQVVLFPGEAFAGYQLLAQRLRPDAFVLSIGYGECWPGYIPTAAAFAEGFGSDWRWVAPGAAGRLSDALWRLLPGGLAAAPPGEAGEEIARDVFEATAANPRYSEGSILELAGGRLLHAVTEFAGDGEDFAPARIVARLSGDGGRTWGEMRVLQENSGRRNVMSVSLLRLRSRAERPIAMFYLVKNGFDDLKVHLRLSSDEGESFGEPILVSDAPGYHVMNNDRAIELLDGRLLCPVAWTADVRRDNRFVSFSYLSDDGGRTWRSGAGRVELPRRGAMEPEALELEDGRILMLLRTQLGGIHASLSSDRGETWSTPAPWGVESPESPATLRRIPATGDLLLVWNPRHVEGAGHGGRRTPLAAAISSDEGRTWSHRRLLEEDPERTYAYTSLAFAGGRALLSYYVRDEESGRISSRFRSLPLAWFYAGGPLVGPPPAAVVEAFSLAPFYEKHLDAGGLPVVGSAKVSSYALHEARYIVDRLLEHRPDVRAALVENKVRLAVMAPSELTTDIPEHADLRPRSYWDRRARGLGATRRRPAVSCGEENLLGYPGDPYRRENILIHEFAHAIHEMGLSSIDEGFDRRLKAIYGRALEKGLWKSTYAATNHKEYWAEGVQSWFDTNRENDAQHNHVSTREELEAYDPELAALIAETFRGTSWRYRHPSERGRKAHLEGFAPGPEARFEWPVSLPPR